VHQTSPGNHQVSLRFDELRDLNTWFQMFNGKGTNSMSLPDLSPLTEISIPKAACTWVGKPREISHRLFCR
jgi:hypothetical protein